MKPLGFSSESTACLANCEAKVNGRKPLSYAGSAIRPLVQNVGQCNYSYTEYDYGNDLIHEIHTIHLLSSSWQGLKLFLKS